MTREAGVVTTPNLKPSKLPEGWRIVSLGKLASVRNGADHRASEVTEGGYPVIGSGGEFARSSNFAHDGESVLFGRKGTIDRPLYVSGRFWTVDTMFYTVIGPQLVPRYLFYCATTVDYGYFATNTALPSMTQRDIATFKIALPSLRIQTDVVSFLDAHTAKIDSLIGKQEQLIETLAERRQALITGELEADVNPARRDGVEPMSIRLKSVCSVIDIRAGDEVLPLLSVSIHRGLQRRDETTSDQPQSNDLSAYKVCEVGDVVINRMRAFQGAVGIASERGITSPDYLVIRPDKTVDGRWLESLMRSRWFVGQMTSRLRGIGSTEIGTVRTPRINAADLGEIRFIRPSLARQLKTLDYLNHETTKIDTLAAKAREMINVLKERRQALISAAVTGKIDVRGLS